MLLQDEACISWLALCGIRDAFTYVGYALCSLPRSSHTPAIVSGAPLPDKLCPSLDLSLHYCKRGKLCIPEGLLTQGGAALREEHPPGLDSSVHHMGPHTLWLGQLVAAAGLAGPRWGLLATY